MTDLRRDSILTNKGAVFLRQHFCFLWQTGRLVYVVIPTATTVTFASSADVRIEQDCKEISFVWYLVHVRFRVKNIG